MVSRLNTISAWCLGCGGQSTKEFTLVADVGVLIGQVATPQENFPVTVTIQKANAAIECCESIYLAKINKGIDE
jgi:hypothetical protein